jgi:hypothetical protein
MPRRWRSHNEPIVFAMDFGLSSVFVYFGGFYWHVACEFN